MGVLGSLWLLLFTFVVAWARCHLTHCRRLNTRVGLRFSHNGLHDRLPHRAIYITYCDHGFSHLIYSRSVQPTNGCTTYTNMYDDTPVVVPTKGRRTMIRKKNSMELSGCHSSVIVTYTFGSLDHNNVFAPVNVTPLHFLPVKGRKVHMFTPECCGPDSFFT